MRRRPHKGFSLVEVLMAIFILGIGVIAIAALFPAGIAQQQQSVDDIIGPIVANNAMSVIRSKVKPEDFGYQIGAPNGDFAWLRPGFYLADTSLSIGVDVPAGSIDIFNDTETDTDSELAPAYVGVPATPPHIIITQWERYYPMHNRVLGGPQPTPDPPQYVWDCMFRRFQGRILVAVFVYRVAIIGGTDVAYAVSPATNPDKPPLPYRLDLTPGWDAAAAITGTAASTYYDASDLTQSWQEPRQWLLDDYNNVHRVLSQTRQNFSTAMDVELVRPIPAVPNLPVYTSGLIGAGPVGSAYLNTNIIQRIFYIPREMKIDANPADGPSNDLPASLTAVFVTVREL